MSCFCNFLLIETENYKTNRFMIIAVGFHIVILLNRSRFLNVLEIEFENQFTINVEILVNVDG